LVDPLTVYVFLQPIFYYFSKLALAV